MCSACLSLGLECHGYGARPEWMDNGILQRDQASKVRNIVSQSKSKKRRRQQLLTSQPPQAIGDGMCLLSTENMSSSAGPSPNSVDQDPGALAQDESRYQANLMDSNSSMDPVWSLWLSNDIPVEERWFDLESYNFTPTTLQNGDCVQHSAVSPGSSEGLVVLAADLPILHETSEVSSGIEPPNNVQSTNEERTRSAPNELQASASRHDRCWPQKAASYDLVGSSSQVSTLSGGTEDTLFMYYLDRVFYVQYPFHDSQNRQGRGWLFTILRRVKSVYHAALALSERHLLSKTSRNNDIASSLVQLRTQNGHYDLGIRETQTMVDDCNTSNRRAHLIPSLEILTSLLQLLFCEVRMIYLL